MHPCYILIQVDDYWVFNHRPHGLLELVLGSLDLSFPYVLPQMINFPVRWIRGIADEVSIASFCKAVTGTAVMARSANEEKKKKKQFSKPSWLHSFLRDYLASRFRCGTTGLRWTISWSAVQRILCTNHCGCEQHSHGQHQACCSLDHPAATH